MATAVNPEDLNKSTTFWDSVSEIYSKNSMTTHDNDHELAYIFDIVNHTKNLQTLICLGVADGCRDPMAILHHIDQTDKPLPLTICNDLSAELLKVCADRVSKIEGIQSAFYPGPMHELEVKEEYENPNPTLVIGVYNADHIDYSLSLYLENVGIIGKEFTVSILTMTDDYLTQSEDHIKFDITDYKKHLDALYELRNSNKDFVAYSITTNTGFITHYYTVDGLEKMCKLVFGKYSISVKPIGSRYVVADIKKDADKESTTLITTLNNVVGNIPWHLQIPSLFSIHKNFFQ